MIPIFDHPRGGERLMVELTGSLNDSYAGSVSLTMILAMILSDRIRQPRLELPPHFHG